jgi:lipopolysaccharide/colanic/teichoic acid biosynthesis glycosyltransferase
MIVMPTPAVVRCAASPDTEPDSAPPAAFPTIWGLDPIQLHDYYWAARGVQVVRLGEPSSVVDGAEMFLLTDSHTLALFRVRGLIDTLSWVAPLVLFVRVHETRQRPYQEFADTEPNSNLRSFVRSYACQYSRAARVAFTTDPDIARAWQAMRDTPRPWQRIRRQIPTARRASVSVRGQAYDLHSRAELDRYTRDLVRTWHKPSASIARATAYTNAVWTDPDASVADGARFVGGAWIGAGRRLNPDDLVVGPAILWDDPGRRPLVQTIQWFDLEPTAPTARPTHIPQRSSISRGFKRVFDVVFSIFAILLTLPLYPFILAAIFLEDGYPFFFTHARETLGGREFPCLKFRSMRKDAEKIKAALAASNLADGPQFYMKDDPRLTRVGRFLRKTNMDELPQFFNVLLGHMSVVGPRPSPRDENQFCPAWREARLSVRPGVTGLWQVNRTRIRGNDFQEWIKYDIQYVENQSWALDLRILIRTIRVVLRGITSL